MKTEAIKRRIEKVEEQAGANEEELAIRIIYVSPDGTEEEGETVQIPGKNTTTVYMDAALKDV